MHAQFQGGGGAALNSLLVAGRGWGERPLSVRLAFFGEGEALERPCRIFFGGGMRGVAPGEEMV